MKKHSFILTMLIFGTVLIIGCKDNLTGLEPELPPSFYKKVDNNLQPILIDLFNEIKEGEKSNIELSIKYSSALMPVDSLFRVLVAVRTSDKSVKKDLERFNCEIRNEGVVDLFCWIPVSNFVKVAKLEKVLSIRTKGIFVTY